MWQMANSNKKTLSKNLTQMKVRYHAMLSISCKQSRILNKAHYAMTIVYEETVSGPYRQALGRSQRWSSH